MSACAHESVCGWTQHLDTYKDALIHTQTLCSIHYMCIRAHNTLNWSQMILKKKIVVKIIYHEDWKIRNICQWRKQAQTTTNLERQFFLPNWQGSVWIEPKPLLICEAPNQPKAIVLCFDQKQKIVLWDHVLYSFLFILHTNLWKILLLNKSIETIANYNSDKLVKFLASPSSRRVG